MSQNQENDSDRPLGQHTNENGPENDGNELNELMALKAKVQILEAREKLLEKKLQESQDKSATLEEKYLKEIAELEMKNQKMTEEFEEKIKKLEEMIQMNGQKIGETENEIMASIREMKVQLPLENWHDLLAFVPRLQLGNVVSEIGDRQFARIIQSFIHDPVREITLGSMEIIPPRPYVSNDQPMVHVRPNAATNMPDWQMPGNIKDFKGIDLKYVDTSVLNFFKKFQENSLLTDVNLQCYYINEDILLQVLPQIVPLISSLDSIAIDLLPMVYNNNDEKNNSKAQLLLMEMMENTRILSTNWQNSSDSADDSRKEKMDWCCSWLYSPRNDGKPRILRTKRVFHQTTDCASFIERIKKDFEMANHAISFFLNVSRIYRANVEDTSFENVKTNEKLVIKTKRNDSDWNQLLISRYPLKAANSWIEANEKEIFEWNAEDLNRKIYMDGKLRMAM